MINIYIFFFQFFSIIDFFSFIFISWRLITLQYCSGFCHTLTWISHGFTCVPHPDPSSRLPPHLIPLGVPSAPALSTCLMHPTIIDYYMILNIVPLSLLFIYFINNSMYLLIPNSQFIPLPLFPFSNHVCFLCLWVNFYSVNKFICITLLDPTCKQ